MSLEQLLRAGIIGLGLFTTAASRAEDPAALAGLAAQASKGCVERATFRENELNKYAGQAAAQGDNETAQVLSTLAARSAVQAQNCQGAYEKNAQLQQQLQTAETSPQ